MPIYFARERGHNLIKIGWAKVDPVKRVISLQTGCPHKLEIIATREGSLADEEALHRKHATLNHRSEWFAMGPEIAVDIVMSSPAFAILAGLEPRILDLARTLGELEYPPTFCAAVAWYGRGEYAGVRPLLPKLIGWNRVDGPMELKTQESYDTVYDALQKLIPDCRDCNCFSMEEES
jgi:hypothetical protein